MLSKEKLKNELKASLAQYPRYFLKQGAFSLYHCKNMDKILKKAYEIVLAECFEDFCPPLDLVPFCVLASKRYASNSLCANESLNLLFVYKNVKVYQIKPMIKAFFELLNDMNLQIDYTIIELDGLKNIAKNELKLSIIQTRFICGSKPLFKRAKEAFESVLNAQKEYFARAIFENLRLENLPFNKQEFDIKNDFGGLKPLMDLENLLALFKNSPKSFALNFINEKELAQLRLTRDFLLSLKGAMNLMSQKDEDKFSLANADEIAKLMYKKDKKNLNAKEALIQKSLQNLHTSGLYTEFLCQKIARTCLNENFSNQNAINPENEFKNLAQALEFLLVLKDKPLIFDIEFVFKLKKLSFNEKESAKIFALFWRIFERKNSFCLLKLLLDSGQLNELCKPFMSVRFLSDEENIYSFDIQALLALNEFERTQNELELSKEEGAIVRLVIFLSAINLAAKPNDEVSLASIFRFYAGKFNLKAQNLELGIRLFKYYKSMKEIIEKEDIYNDLIISTLLSRIENSRTLEILHFLTLTKAHTLNLGAFFYKSLNKLFENARQGFEDASLLDETSRRVKKEQTLRRSEAYAKLSPKMQDKINHIKSNLFIIKNSFEDIIKISQTAQENDFKIWLSNETNLNLQIVARENFRLEIVLNSLAHLNLIFMSFFPLFDDKIYLKFEYNNIISNAQKEQLESLLKSNLKSNLKIKLKKPNIKKDELKFDFEYSKAYAKLNLNTKDEQGLMAYLMSVFNEFKLTLSAAKIQTIRQRTRNTFYFLKTPALDEQKLIKTLTSE